MLNTKVILLTIFIFAFRESAAIVKKMDKKCAISDEDCLKTIHNSLLAEIADNGIQELGIPKIDPLKVQNMEVNVLGMLKVTLKDGTAKGFKSCSSTVFTYHMENLSVTVVYVCDLFAIEGDYKLESTPTLLALDGGIDVHGEGKGCVVIEKVQINFEFPFVIKKFDDCELHFQVKPTDTTYTFEVLGKATADADSLFVGSQDISSVAVNIFNENWKALSNILGKSMLNKIVDFFHENLQNFFDAVPIKDWITDDLSSYVKS